MSDSHSYTVSTLLWSLSLLLQPVWIVRGPRPLQRKTRKWFTVLYFVHRNWTGQNWEYTKSMSSTASEEFPHIARELSYKAQKREPSNICGLWCGLCILYHFLGISVQSKERSLSLGMYGAGSLKGEHWSTILHVSPLFGPAACIIYGLGASTASVNVPKTLWGYLWPPGKGQGEAFWALRI